MKPLKVSVCMTVYNQVNYVAQAIESVLYQSVGAPFELVIGEDRSTDGTLAICEEYQRRHQGVIRLHRRAQNLGCAGNQAAAWAACRGEYIAMLDGDDYWSSPLKLRTQVAFLDQHPEYSMCFTRCGLVSDKGDRHDRWPYRENLKTTLQTADILRHNLIANCSVMYRPAFRRLPEWLVALPYCDIAMHVLHSLGGPIGYIPDDMAVYRLHGTNYFEGMSFLSRVEWSSKLYAAMAEHLPEPHASQAAQVLLMMRLGMVVKDARDSLALWGSLPWRYRLTWPSIPLEQIYHLWVIRKPEKNTKGGADDDTADDRRSGVRGAPLGGGRTTGD